MLAPIRDHLRPQDPNSSPLLCAAKDCYFTRLSVEVGPNLPGFKEARWVVTEDMNVEFLLDTFTTLDMNSEIVWDACIGFMGHLYWHKPRYTVLGPKVEGLADCHHSKPTCLIQLSRLSQEIGNYVEQTRLVSHALRLAREGEDDFQVAYTLRLLSDASRMLGLHEEGIQQTKEALEINERLGNIFNQAECWSDLSGLFCSVGQLEAAEKAGSRAIELLPEEGQEFCLSQFHQSLGRIYEAKKEREKAIYHFEKAIGIASTFEWPSELFSIHYGLAALFLDEDGFDDAHSHVDQAKLYAAGSPHDLGWAMERKAQIWYRQRRLEHAASEASGALEIYEKLGASNDIVDCKDLLQEIEQAMAAHGTPPSASNDTSSSH